MILQLVRALLTAKKATTFLTLLSVKLETLRIIFAEIFNSVSKPESRAEEGEQDDMIAVSSKLI